MNATDDWFQVSELPTGDWRISEPPVFGDYLLAGEERALLLDASVGVGDLREMVDDLVDVPVTLLLTHSHWDHVGAAHQFDDVRVHEAELPPDGTVRSDYVASEFPYGLDEWLADWQGAGREFPDGFDPDTYEIRPAPGAEAAAGGETVDLGGRTLELLHLPGHAPGQLGALDRERGVLYGGDVVHVDYSLYIHFGGCDVHDYVDTLGRLRELRDEGAFETLYTAHNDPLSGDELSILDELHEGLRAILDGELSHEPLEGQLPGRRYEVGGHEILTGPDVA
jgi:glyoxylase-like metal-dependent hydrolase (beta-lactamase superfamily II)